MKKQAEFEIVRAQFAAAVAAGRGSRFDINAALASEAACFMGEEAVKQGLADAVAQPSAAFEAFVREF
jgi:ClpP class serine protease